MDYKKAYKEALERAKNYCDGHHTDVNPQKAMEYIFPELKESEDERIRKSLIKSCINSHSSNFPTVDGFTREQILAWLEKQGEKSIPENINEAALQYVDTCAVDGEVTHDNITEPYWNNHSMMKAYKAGWLEKQGEQKSVDYEAELKKCKDNPLYFYDKYVSIKQKPSWSEEDESLPKWKRNKPNEKYIHNKGYYLAWNELENLPKEE